MKALKELTHREIFTQVHQFCVLSDIDPPPDESALGMMIEFIWQHHGNYDSRILQWAFEYWLQGDIDLMKPRRINAFFMSQIIKKSVKDGLVKHPFPPQPVQINQEKQFSEAEILATSKRVYEMVENEFYLYYRSNAVKLVLNVMQSLFNYINTHVEQLEYPTEFLQAMTTEVIMYHTNRQNALNQQEKLYHCSAIQKYMDMPKVEMHKVASVWGHFYTKNQNLIKKIEK